VLVVTTGVRDARGRAIGSSDNFRHYRDVLKSDGDAYYRQALDTSVERVRRALPRDLDVAALSVFTTQSSSHIVERMREAIHRAPPPTLNFNVGPNGTRAVFADPQISTLTDNQDVNAGGPLVAQTLDSAQWRLVPGAVGTVAFGRYTTLDFTTRPSGHIAPIPTRTGTLTPTGTLDVAIDVWLPAGTRPPAGWPVVIYGTGSFGTKNSAMALASVFASHGLATIGVNGYGHGRGPRTTMTILRTDGTTVTFAAPGAGFDQDGDGVINAWEPQRAQRPHAVLNVSGTFLEETAQYFALVRALQAGADVDGDGAADLDAARIYYVGQSQGASTGLVAFVYVPAMRAAVFTAGAGTPLYSTLSGPSSADARTL
jgi:hypothetical protein